MTILRLRTAIGLAENDHLVRRDLRVNEGLVFGRHSSRRGRAGCAVTHGGCVVLACVFMCISLTVSVRVRSSASSRRLPRQDKDVDVVLRKLIRTISILCGASTSDVEAKVRRSIFLPTLLPPSARNSLQIKPTSH